MKALSGWILLLISVFAYADNNSLYQSMIYKQGEQTLQYRILYPQSFDKHKRYPLVLFLHGAGERGSDNTLQLTHGGALFADNAVRDDYPAIVVFPQVPKDQYWANVSVNRDTQPVQLHFSAAPVPTQVMALTLALVDELVAKPYVDDRRVYIGGLSMGGMGTLEMLYHRPDMFAAAIAICGGGNEQMATHYRKGMPVWLFHGEEDQVVDPELSRQMHSAIVAADGQAKLTLYPGVGHDSWTAAFAEPTLLPWLFSHQLP